MFFSFYVEAGLEPGLLFLAISQMRFREGTASAVPVIVLNSWASASGAQKYLVR
jgi:hypothetical protein